MKRSSNVIMFQGKPGNTNSSWDRQGQGGGKWWSEEVETPFLPDAGRCIILSRIAVFRTCPLARSIIIFLVHVASPSHRRCEAQGWVGRVLSDPLSGGTSVIDTSLQCLPLSFRITGTSVLPHLLPLFREVLKHKADVQGMSYHDTSPAWQLRGSTLDQAVTGSPKPLSLSPTPRAPQRGPCSSGSLCQASGVLR